MAQLGAFAARSSVPRVRALHLPPLQPNADSKGEFCALELEDGSVGLSYVLLDDTLARLHAEGDSLGIAGTDALQLARRYAGADFFGRALGFAAANALTRCLYDRAGFRPGDSADSIGQMQPQAGEHIGMIGLFRPLLGRILSSGARLTVVELKAELAGSAEGYRVTLDADELATCDKVVSTSTLLLNDTLDRMLGCCRNAKWFAMVGPSAGCLPDALFARGVTLLGGSWIIDRRGFLDALRRGESRSEYADKFALTRDDYPGFNALLSRACGTSVKRN
ncbi:MAG: hypothetical protein IPL72_05035 [Sulfuritalea sp.]|nr:hypothetical protein [Sulfuritalea sp.]